MKKILEKPEEHINNKFILKGYITGFADTNPKNIIKKMEKGTNNIVALSYKAARGKKYMALFNLLMIL